MGKIGDLWVRLGLKSDDYKRGMDAAKKQTSSFAGGLDKMKAGALAVWAAVGAAVTKFAKDFISATNTINDKWQATMSGIKASYQSVLADMSTYKPDFSSFRNFFKNEWNWIKKTFGNAKEAGDAAQEMTKAFDAEFELVNSVKLQKAMIQEELNDLYVKMRDTTLSPADRQAAAERYKALLQPLADAEVRIYGQMMEAASKAWQAGAGLSREYSSAEIKDFFANYGVNPEATKAKYGELASVYENRKGDEQNRVIFDILTRWEQANAQMSDVNKVLSRTTNSIKKELQGFDLNLAEELEAGLQDVNEYIDELDLAMERLQEPSISLPVIGFQTSKKEAESHIAELGAITNVELEGPSVNMTELNEGLSQIDAIELVTDTEIQGPTLNLSNLYEGLSDIDKAVAQSYYDALMSADLEFPEIDLSAFDKAIEELKAKGAEWVAEQEAINSKIEHINGMLGNAIVSSISNGVQAFTSMLTNLGETDASQVLAALMQPFADMAIQMGELLIADGIAMEALDKSSKTLQGAPAIAAGVALVAVGAAMRAGVQAIAKTGGSSASSASTYDSGSYGTQGYETYESNITVEVVGRISGSDILIAGSNQQKKWNR